MCTDERRRARSREIGKINLKRNPKKRLTRKLVRSRPSQSVDIHIRLIVLLRNGTGRRRDLRARIDAAAKQQNRKGGKKKKAQDEEVRLELAENLLVQCGS